MNKTYVLRISGNKLIPQIWPNFNTYCRHANHLTHKELIFHVSPHGCGLKCDLHKSQSPAIFSSCVTLTPVTPYQLCPAPMRDYSRYATFHRATNSCKYWFYEHSWYRCNKKRNENRCDGTAIFTFYIFYLIGPLTRVLRSSAWRFILKVASGKANVRVLVKLFF